jgi:hypothetical protein
MPAYTVHELPPPPGQSDSDPARIMFVPDGFSFWAFLFGPLWLLWHRLWLALVGYIVVAIVLHLALVGLGAQTETRIAVSLLFALLFGLEANSLRRWTFSRRSWKNVGIVVADDIEHAERRFFDAWTGQITGRSPRAAAAPPALPAAATARGGAGDVIGVFPKPGRWP